MTTKPSDGIKITSGLFEESGLRKLGSFLVIKHGITSASDKLQTWKRNLEERSRSRGRLETVQFAKKCYDIACRYASGMRFEPIPFVKSDKSGFPSCLKFLKDLLSGSFNERRTALSILQIYQLVAEEGNFPSYDSIVQSGPIKPSEERTVEIGKALSDCALPKNFKAKLISSWKAELDIAFPSDTIASRTRTLQKASKLHISSKNGPNGPAVSTSVVDWEVLNQPTNSELLKSIKEMALETKNEVLEELLAVPPENVTRFRGKREKSHSRIRVKHEPGGKTRLFCIVDFFSQSALTGIHQVAFSWLERQEQDGTFSHNNCARKVANWTRLPRGKGLDVCSMDLSKATDRWPRALQREVVCQMFGQRIAYLWEQIISSREFDPPSVPPLKVAFSVGQPLGALSSWGVFAICHHILVRALFRTLDIRSSEGKYRLIGDDIAIRVPAVGRAYVMVVQSLGVEISKVKSFLPEGYEDNAKTHLLKDENTSNRYRKMKIDPGTPGTYHSAEMAKRIIVNGQEITPVPPKAILEGLSSPSGFVDLLRAMDDRGYDADCALVPVPALAELLPLRERRAALLQATNPVLPAPNYVRVTKSFREASSRVSVWTLGDRDFGMSEDIFEIAKTWYSYPYPLLLDAFYVLWNAEVEAAVGSVRRLGTKYLEYTMRNYVSPSGTVPTRVACWEMSRKSVSRVLIPVLEQGTESLVRIRTELHTKALTSVPSDLWIKPMIGQLQTLLDLEDIVLGKSRYDEVKSRTSKKLCKILRNVLRSLSV